MRKNGFAHVFVLMIVLLLIFGLSYFVYAKNDDDSGSSSAILENITNSVQHLESNENPTPTPFPFQEMTIPYLRTQVFDSNLSSMQKFSDNANYTSYLTSYQSEGLKVNGLLTVPKGSKPEAGWPAIIFVHGYIPPTLYRTTERYSDYVDYLARNGFVVFKIDLRGHGSSEGIPMGSYYASEYVIDTLNAYSALQNTDFVNTKRIGLWGHSMAGNILLRTFAVRPDIPAVVVWAGAGYTYTDLQSYGIDDNSYRPPTDDSERRRKREELRAAHGEFDSKNTFWQMVNPENYIEDLKGAIELHHAIDDSVVSIEYSRNLDRVLEASTIDHTLFEYQTGGHNITGSSFGRAMQRTVEFYRRHLND